MITKAISDPAVDFRTQSSGVLGVARNREADRRSRERRRETSHPGKFKPELLADGPSRVWTRKSPSCGARPKGAWEPIHYATCAYVPAAALSYRSQANMLGPCAPRQPIDDFRISVPLPVPVEARYTCSG
ncbi:MAG TPA: hypothetical protein VMU94_18460 [Streptosporangiaceae bacterium]|nr:hypothetical protein [Streptosporangiaceae bacterium]